MRKFLVVTLGCVSIAGAAMTETSSASKVQYSEKELKAYCDKKGGNFSTSDSGGYGCAIGSSDKGVTITCTASGKCNMYNTVVFTLPPTHASAAGQAASTTGVSGNAAGSTSGGGRASTGGNASGVNSTSAAGVSSTSKSATKTAPVTVSTTTGAGGGMPQSGRPGLRQQ